MDNLDKLGLLAMKFRGVLHSENVDIERKQIAEEYAKVWEDFLAENTGEFPTFEERLTDEYMPESFFEKIRSKRMITWRVQIPAPPAKRMKDRKLVITNWSAWESFPDKIIDLLPEQTEFKFELSDGIDWKGSTSIIDGHVFDVYITNKNSTGSRTKLQHLVPEKLALQP